MAPSPNICQNHENHHGTFQIRHLIPVKSLPKMSFSNFLCK
jgi:hypothetical protein